MSAVDLLERNRQKELAYLKRLAEQKKIKLKKKKK
jgi:hypothetical protein